MKKVSPNTAFSAFKPESCVFVISYDNKLKRPSGMIAGWSMKCSTDPYLFAVALWDKGYTHKLIKDTKEFVVAVPNKSLEKAVNIFGSYHGDKVNKFEKSKVKTMSSKHIRPPLLNDATINFECELHKEMKAGDHFILVGKVLEAYVNKDKKVMLNMGRDKDSKRIFKDF